MQSGLKPCVLDSRPSREAIFSLTELSVSWKKIWSSSEVFCFVSFNWTTTLRHSVVVFVVLLLIFCVKYILIKNTITKPRRVVLLKIFIFIRLMTVLYLVVVLQKNPDHTLHTLCLYRLSCKVQQILQGISRVGGFTEVNVQSCRFTGFGQTQLLGWNVFMGNLSA